MTLAACAVVGAAVILLIAGTQWFDWPWLIGVAVLAAGAGIWRAARSLPSPYRAAQRVDRGAGLKDSLSTAVFFASPEARVEEQNMRVSQRREAERLAASVDLRAALPLTAPRSAYALSALVLVASSLFALRYGVQHRMDLRAPLARVLLPWLGIQPELPAEARNREKKSAKDRRSPDVTEAQGKQGSPDMPPLQGIDVPDVDTEKSSAAVTPQDQRGQETSEQDANASEQANAGEAGQNETASNQKQNRGEEGADRKPTNAPANSTLMSKLRDAMQNLMSRLKQPPSAGGTPQESKNGQQQAKGEQQKGSGQQQGQAQQGRDQSGADSQESREGQGGEQGGNSQMAEGKSASPGANDPSRNPSSGVGKQDGNKDPRLAEQLAAMGKISEIIGKRSANITGEISVEVRSSSQQLKTAYSGAAGERADRGGEVHRDEVPAALEHYVQQYFAEVRKQAAKSE